MCLVHRASCIACLLPLLLSGCVKRAMVIESDPPGATVLLNGHTIGVTPLEHPFITHGRYRLTLAKSGFHDVSVREWVNAPWHQWIPLDFFTENLLPIPFDDTHTFRYTLRPLKPDERFSREPAPTLDELLGRLRAAGNPAGRRQACILLARYHLMGGVPALEDATHDVDPEVRTMALHALRVLAGREALPHLTHALSVDESAMVRWQAATELEALKAPQAESVLTTALHDRDTMVRAAAIEALRGLRLRSAAIPISWRLHDPDIVVRRSAADALGTLGDPNTAWALGRALRDEDPGVRRRAAKSLLTLRVPESSEALAKALRDSDPEVREIAVEALGQFGTPLAAPIAIRIMRSWQPAVRASAAAALGVLHDPRAIPPLQRSVRREGNVFTRLAMARALETLGSTPPGGLRLYIDAVNAEAARQRAREEAAALEDNPQ